VRPPILSREELAALMEGLGSEPQPATNPSSLAIQPMGAVIDPTQDAGHARTAPGTVSVQAWLPALDSLHRNFAVGFSAALSRMAHRKAELVAQVAQVWTLHDWVKAVNGPMLTNTVRIRHVTGPGVVAFESPWLRGLVDLMFGGSGTEGNFAQRIGASSVERVVCARLTRQVCQVYTSALAATPSVRMTWQRSEVRLGASGFPQLQEKVATTSFALKHGLVPGRLWIVLPTSAIKLLCSPFDAPMADTFGRDLRA
jgi:flagellar motor switch protein FliM